MPRQLLNRFLHVCLFEITLNMKRDFSFLRRNISQSERRPGRPGPALLVQNFQTMILQKFGISPQHCFDPHRHSTSLWPMTERSCGTAVTSLCLIAEVSPLWPLLSCAVEHSVTNRLSWATAPFRFRLKFAGRTNPCLHCLLGAGFKTSITGGRPIFCNDNVAGRTYTYHLDLV